MYFSYNQQRKGKELFFPWFCDEAKCGKYFVQATVEAEAKLMTIKLPCRTFKNGVSKFY